MTIMSDPIFWMIFAGMVVLLPGSVDFVAEIQSRFWRWVFSLPILAPLILFLVVCWHDVVNR